MQFLLYYQINPPPSPTTNPKLHALTKISSIWPTNVIKFYELNLLKYTKWNVSQAHILGYRCILLEKKQIMGSIE